MNGHDAFQRRHTHVGVEMVTHRLGEGDAGFVAIAINLIKGLIQLRIVAPATKGAFQVGQPIDMDLDLDLCSVWKKDGLLKFDRSAVNFSFYGLCHTPASFRASYCICRLLAKRVRVVGLITGGGDDLVEDVEAAKDFSQYCIVTIRVMRSGGEDHSHTLSEN